jgi:hypothetical protein
VRATSGAQQREEAIDLRFNNKRVGEKLTAGYFKPLCISSEPYRLAVSARTTFDMITITVGWEWALGIFGLLILIAWKGSARFTALEISMEWIKRTLNELKIAVDNANGAKSAFGAGSSVDLKPVGVEWLVDSGLKAYIDENKQQLLDQCKENRSTNLYELERHIFYLFDRYRFPAELDDGFKRFAFEKGTSMAIIRRVGAIYLRNLCVQQFETRKGGVHSDQTSARDRGYRWNDIGPKGSDKKTGSQAAG